MARLAARQHGAVSFAQLGLLSMGRGAIQHRVAHARFYRRHRGVYLVMAPAIAPPLACLMAAVLACSGRAVVGHRSAAWLWGFVPAPPDRVEVTVDAASVWQVAGIVKHRDRLQRREVTRRRGIPVTSAARTLIDYAGDATPAELERAVEKARRDRLVSSRGLRTALRRAPRGRGAGLEAVLDSRQGPVLTRSEAEVRFVELVRAAQLSRPEHNVRVGRFEVDTLWREEGLVVEIDGYAFHSGRAAFERDRSRDAELQAAGLRVLRFTWRQLVHEPEVVLARVAQSLVARPGFRQRPPRSA